MFFIFLGACAFLMLAFWYIKDYRYWRVRNVKHDLPLPLFGNHFKNLFGKRTEIEKCTEMYNKYSNEKIVGYYRGKTPELIIRDPYIIRHILSNDFSHFYGRGFNLNLEETLFLNVFHAQGDRWKILRHSISPAFTSTKLRSMFPLIKNCTDRLQIFCQELSENEKEISAYELMARYSIEFIGACGFGINFNTLTTESSIFFELGKTIFTKSKRQMWLLALRELFPQNEFLKNLSITRSNTVIMIRNIVKNIRTDRTINSNKRHDFVEVLLELEKSEKIIGESLTKRDVNGIPLKAELCFTEKYTIAQLFIFFAAGFETSASTTSWTLYQLAHYPVIQRKIQDEIDITLKKYNYLCYDAIMELTYLEMTIKEAMRTFSAGGYISRECMSKYTIPGTDVTIDPGVTINIPVQALHLDAQYYDNPLEFRPERFSAEQEQNHHKYVYLPFGEGPRKCIGHRLGLLETMTGLVAILQNFNVEPAFNYKQNFEIKRNSFVVQAVKDKIPILLKPRNI